MLVTAQRSNVQFVKKATLFKNEVDEESSGLAIATLIAKLPLTQNQPEKCVLIVENLLSKVKTDLSVVVKGVVMGNKLEGVSDTPSIILFLVFYFFLTHRRQ